MSNLRKKNNLKPQIHQSYNPQRYPKRRGGWLKRVAASEVATYLESLQGLKQSRNLSQSLLLQNKALLTSTVCLVKQNGCPMLTIWSRQFLAWRILCNLKCYPMCFTEPLTWVKIWWIWFLRWEEDLLHPCFGQDPMRIRSPHLEVWNHPLLKSTKMSMFRKFSVKRMSISMNMSILSMRVGNALYFEFSSLKDDLIQTLSL